MIDTFFTNLIFFLIYFLIVFLFEYYILTKQKNKKKRIEKLTMEGMFLIKRFDLDDQKIILSKLNFHISIINAFIISIVTTIIYLTNFHILIKLAIAFVLLLALIYAIYELYGRRIKKIWGKNNNK